MRVCNLLKKKTEKGVRLKKFFCATATTFAAGQSSNFITIKLNRWISEDGFDCRNRVNKFYCVFHFTIAFPY